MTAFNILRQRYQDILSSSTVCDGGLHFSVELFKQNSGFSEAFNNAVIAELPKLLRTFPTDDCHCKDVCEFRNKSCRLKKTFNPDDLLWLGIRRQISLASSDELYDEITVEDLSFNGRHYCINGAISPNQDIDIIKKLNSSRNVCVVRSTDVIDVAENSERIFLSSAQLIYTETQVVKKNISIALNQLKEQASFLQLSNLPTRSLIWSNEAPVEVTVTLVQPRTKPLPISVNFPPACEFSDDSQEPVKFDIMLNMVDGELKLQPYCEVVTIDGERRNIIIQP